MLIAPLVALAALVASGQAPEFVPATIPVPAGEFLMGSQEGAAWEQPVHPVELGRFWFSEKPVSNAAYQAFAPDHQSLGDKAPEAAVTGVGWDEANRYCEWLSEQTGQTYRLPSEARWERAMRGDLRQKTYSWGDEAPVRTDLDAPAAPAPRKNSLGIIAYSGNLWEWTADWYAADYYSESPDIEPTGPAQGRYRVLRGGGFRDDPNSVKVYNRGSARPTTTSEYITFRVVREGEQTAAPAAPQITEFRPPAGTQIDSRGIFVRTEESIPETLAKSQPEPVPAKKKRQGKVKISVPPRPLPKPTVAPAPKVESVAAAKPKAVPAKPSMPKPAADSGAELTKVVVERSGSGVTIRLIMNQRSDHRQMLLSGPDRLVIDLNGASVKTGRLVDERAVGFGGVSKVRWSQFALEPPVARVVIDMDSKLDFTLNPANDGLAILLQ